MRTAVTAFALVAALALPAVATAHCDTLDGPVVAAARTALAAGDPAPVLIWVRAEDEPAIRDAFARTLAARAEGEAARALADVWFFETLVRVHRAGEGFPYTGLQPAGAPIAPAVAAADRALEQGDASALAAELAGAVEHGVRERFERARAARAHLGRGIEAGRAYVAAYVELTHYAEAVAAATAGSGAHAEPAATSPAPAAAAHAHP